MKRRIFYAQNKTIVYGFRTAIASFSHLLFAYGPFLRNEASGSSRAAPALLAPPPSRSMNVGMHYLPFYTSACCRTRSIGASCPQPPDLIGLSVAPIPCRHAMLWTIGRAASGASPTALPVASLSYMRVRPTRAWPRLVGSTSVSWRDGGGAKGVGQWQRRAGELWALNSGGQWRAHAH